MNLTHTIKERLGLIEEVEIVADNDLEKGFKVVDQDHR